jgi:hypothetical protein
VAAGGGQRRKRAGAICVAFASLLGMVTAGCAPVDRTSVAPSIGPSVLPTTSSSVPPPTAATSASASTAVAVDMVVRTVVPDLQARSAPSLGASSRKVEPLLPQDSRLFVIAGPISADGFAWYQVLSFDGVFPGVWIPLAGLDGTPWLEPDPQPCPTPPLDATALGDLVPYGGLACYGGTNIQLMGDVHCELGDVDRAYSGPDWLRDDRSCTIDLGGGETMEIFDGGIPGLTYPMTQRALVSGHFDDPKAASCVYALDPPAPDPATVVVNCRAMFVGTGLEAAP